ncbi:tRNA (cytosine(34)-C(5))-methyltransferase, mitochondrial [Thalassophryne amazonica]|uniref:tRNA (cytosine(34)-C(5))-methyltransferase, mitochondrial n=1 Tax=Thalassophryne amazonica TaxID=390379 RepID=UPI001471F074|nr:tRNA (cytosine(34)-C(5))-methyltransferase, mitochondrial [Thalassophryne amazonica]
MFSMHRLYAHYKKIRFKSVKAVSLCNFQTGPDCDLLRTQQQTNQVVKGHKKAKSACQPVLVHFDQQYSQEIGDLWTSAKAVLLDPCTWQHGVMLNRFSILTDVEHILQTKGFSKVLPQTDASTLFCKSPSAVPCTQQRGGKASVIPLDCTLTSLPDESHLYQYSTADALRGHSQSEPSTCQHRPSLQCYIHPYPLRFPSQAHRPGQLKQYYLLNAASLLPVLALQVGDGERVLDLCSAPGGKAVAIMQTATPAFLCCNEPDPHRREWLAKTLESFLPHSVKTSVMVSAEDGRTFGQRQTGNYDKVLVDAPCSNDRSWLYSSSDQQGEQRLKERARLPLVQAQLLRSALSAVRPGGAVVYSTCTLSSPENHAVVDMVLNDCPEAEAEDLWEEIVIPFSKYFCFVPAPPDDFQSDHRPSPQTQHGTVSSYHRRLGILVVPQRGRTWGPMFLCRIRKRK